MRGLFVGGPMSGQSVPREHLRVPAIEFPGGHRYWRTETAECGTVRLAFFVHDEYYVDGDDGAPVLDAIYWALRKELSRRARR